jgi:hypothetical protein
MDSSPFKSYVSAVGKENVGLRYQNTTLGDLVMVGRQAASGVSQAGLRLKFVYFSTSTLEISKCGKFKKKDRHLFSLCQSARFAVI